jgi:hypothetical protein
MYQKFNGEDINIIEFEYDDEPSVNESLSSTKDEDELTVTPDYDYIFPEGKNIEKDYFDNKANFPHFKKQYDLSEMISDFEDRIDMSFLPSQATLDLLNEVENIDAEIWKGTMERKRYKHIRNKINALDKKIKRYERFANY